MSPKYSRASTDVDVPRPGGRAAWEGHHRAQLAHTQLTFVVLDLPQVPVGRGALPLAVLGQAEEGELLAGARHLHDGRDELLEEVLADERRPVVLDEVDQQALDVRAVLVLVGHDHHLAVAQALQVGRRVVVLLVLQAQDLDERVDLDVLHDLHRRAPCTWGGGGARSHLLVVGVAHVEHLAAQREDTKVVAADDAQAGDGQRLGRVALGED